MIFNQRYEAPDKDNPFYCDNRYSRIGYGMPNCTAYAWGRTLEILADHGSGLPDELGIITGNANMWLNNAAAAGWAIGNHPKLGAIICCNCEPDGHVAIVENIMDDYITISQSHWNGEYFDMLTFNWKEDRPFGEVLGYIYNPASIDDITSDENYVRTNYIEYLNRAADKDGLDTFLFTMDSDPQYDLDSAFLLSEEYGKPYESYWYRFNFVVKCYYLILGRFPESIDVVNEWLNRCDRLRDIHAAIYFSEEAINKRRD